jgi:hypothetical protein
VSDESTALLMHGQLERAVTGDAEARLRLLEFARGGVQPPCEGLIALPDMWVTTRGQPPAAPTSASTARRIGSDRIARDMHTGTFCLTRRPACWTIRPSPALNDM